MSIKTLPAVLVCVAGISLSACQTSNRMLENIDTPAPPIGSRFGDRQNPNGFPRSHPHTGLDIMAAAGRTVHAPVSGFVSLAWYSVDTASYPGWQIVIGSKRHPVQKSVVMAVGLTHLRSSLVKTGQFVRAGDPIGVVGEHPNGDHLHYAVYRAADEPIDPAPFLVSDGAIYCVAGREKARRTHRPSHVYPVACDGGFHGLAPVRYE